MTIETPQPRAADIADALASPGRVTQARSSHRDGLRKLAVAVQTAVGRGATYQEILAVVEQAATEEAARSRLAARARAIVHDGDDHF
jgi:hypothetical protein